MSLFLLALLTFQAPHAARVPRATLDAELTKAIDAAQPTDVTTLTESTLGITDARLHFGLSHLTSLRFAGEREGNCIEYAELFASAFNRVASRRRIAARAWVVHSDARVLGEHLGKPGLDDHDWVLIVPASGKRLFVDPTFHDMGLGWDIAASVKGDIRVP